MVNLKNFVLAAVAMLICGIGHCQVTTIEGKAGNQAIWTFDGHTLSIERNSSVYFNIILPDYNVKDNTPPWVKRNLPIKKVKIGYGIERIGSCAFSNCTQLETVEFFNEEMISEIGWGAFLNCTNLFNFSIPRSIKKIEKVAFANCKSLRSVTIPEGTTVEDYAFLSCTNLNMISVATNVALGKAVFATEVQEAGSVKHTSYKGQIRSLPSNITETNCEAYGLAKDIVKEYLSKQEATAQDNNTIASAVDQNIPTCIATRNNTYALVIGNQNYRFAPNVPYARHDAQVFAEYCKRTLGIPTEQVHLREDVTKHMLMEQEIRDWLTLGIADKADKKLIIYYAGHGVPDTQEQNKSYILPTDVYATLPKQGLALDELYTIIGNMGFKHVTMFIDACFSGIDRNNESVNFGERGTEVEAEDTRPTSGNMVVFCAAQGDETAQGFVQQGHGLFTYYLLKEIQRSNGSITYGKLSENIKNDVTEVAPSLQLKKKQTPSTKVSDNIANNWQDIPL